MALHRGALPAGQQPEPLIETPRDLGRSQHRDARRGELDRQRDPVEPSAHLRDRVGVRRVEREARLHRPGPLHEQHHRVALRDRLEPRRVGRHVERRHPQHPLAGDVEALPTRRQHPHPRTPAHDLVDEVRNRAEQVLAVVEHQQQLLAAQELHQRRGRRRRRRDLHPEHRRPTRRGRPRDHAPRRASTSHAPSRYCGTTSAATSSARRVLPTPPTPVNVTTRPLRQLRLDARELRLAPDERRHLHGQVPGQHVQRPQRRELARQRRMGDLEHRDRAA